MPVLYLSVEPLHKHGTSVQQPTADNAYSARATHMLQQQHERAPWIPQVRPAAGR